MKKSKIATAVLLATSAAIVTAPISYAATDQELAETVEKKLNALTINSTEQEVIEARNAYDKLSNSALLFVSKSAFDKLTAQETRIAKQQEKDIKTAQEEAHAMEAMINRLSVSSTREQVLAVKATYDALSPLAKRYVPGTTLVRLTSLLQEIAKQDAIQAAAKASAAAFDKYMASITRQSSGVVLNNARLYYNSLSYEAKQYVTTISKLTRLEEAYTKNPWGPVKQPTHPNTKKEDLTGIVWSGGTSNPAPLTYIPDEEVNRYDGEITIPFEAYEDEFYAYIPQYLIHYQDQKVRVSGYGIELILPVQDLKNTNGAIQVSVEKGNGRFSLKIRSNGNAVYFSNPFKLSFIAKDLNVTTNGIVYQQETAVKKTRVPFDTANGQYTMQLTIGGEFFIASAHPAPIYTDIVKDPNYFFIEEVTSRGYLNGTSDTLFYPNKPITRGDFAIMLAQAANMKSYSTTQFTDLRNKSFAKEIQALHDRGIMMGTGKKYYNVNGQVSRQQAAYILDRYLANLGVDIYALKDAKNFTYTDVGYFSDREKRALALMDSHGIFSVNEAGEFAPYEALTRSEAARLLHLAMELAYSY